MSESRSRDRRGISRRALIRGAAVGIGTAGLGATGTGSVAAQSDFGGWFTDDARGGATGNYDGTVVDRRGQDEVTVTVGAQGNGGTFAFAPPAVRVSPGTTVEFVWESDTHNVLVESQPDGADWSGHEPIENTGFTYTHTFETEGVYKYYCQPHLTMGMKGAIVVESGSGDGTGGGAGVPAEYGDWFTGNANGGATGNYDGTTADRTGADEVTVTVGAQGNGGSFAFDPPAIRISPGTTVTFEWVSDTHNVVVEGQPDGAGWSGHEPIENTDFTYTHTFETEGVYKYYCQPHLTMGMKGALVVGQAPGGAGGAGQEAPGGQPAGYVSVWEALFASSILAAMLAPVFAGYYRRRVTGTRREGGAVQEAPVEEPTREIGHEEYDPRGTVALVLLYFLIVVLMWVFMYFVEFLGNGPTVVG